MKKDFVRTDKVFFQFYPQNAETERENMTDFERDKLTAEKIAEAVQSRGGRAYYVGGYVRDLICGRENKDIDIEIHGISPACLEGILDRFGERIAIGESFGIYNIKGYHIDIAMPRKENVRGSGHRDFDIFVDPFIGTRDAAKRRDFTVNALMQDVLSSEVIDHFGGTDDLNNGILRHVNDSSFAEDPLRVLRAAQFAARFELTVAPETVELCSKMQLEHLSKERIEGELKKALLKAEKPSIFFETLREMNQLDIWFTEIKALIGIEQNRKYHTEGDVWNHTMRVLDAAAKYREKAEHPMGFMLAALTHDVGKAVCTEIINGELHAYAHESKGLPLAEELLRRITNEVKLIEYALNLIELHMKPNVIAKAKSAIKSTNKLFDSAVDPAALIYLATADSEGTITPHSHTMYTDFLFERLEIYRSYMSRPYVMGKDLIQAGLKPSKNFSEILDYAHKLRLAGIGKENALKQTLAYARKLDK